MPDVPEQAGTSTDNKSKVTTQQALAVASGAAAASTPTDDEKKNKNLAIAVLVLDVLSLIFKVLLYVHPAMSIVGVVCWFLACVAAFMLFRNKDKMSNKVVQGQVQATFIAHLVTLLLWVISLIVGGVYGTREANGESEDNMQHLFNTAWAFGFLSLMVLLVSLVLSGIVMRRLTSNARTY